MENTQCPSHIPRKSWCEAVAPFHKTQNSINTVMNQPSRGRASQHPRRSAPSSISNGKLVQHPPIDSGKRPVNIRQHSRNHSIQHAASVFHDGDERTQLTKTGTCKMWTDLRWNVKAWPIKFQFSPFGTLCGPGFARQSFDCFSLLAGRGLGCDGEGCGARELFVEI